MVSSLKIESRSPITNSGQGLSAVFFGKTLYSPEQSVRAQPAMDYSRIPSRETSNTPACFMLQESEISVKMMSHPYSPIR